MRNFLIILFLSFVATALEAQIVGKEQLIYFAKHRDSMVNLYLLLPFKLKNSQNETIEEFGKRNLGKDYQKYFSKAFDPSLSDSLYDLRDFVNRRAFSKMLPNFRKRFFYDEKYKKQFTRTWLSSLIMLKETLCTKKEMTIMLRHTLTSENLHFTNLMIALLNYQGFVVY